MAEKKTSDGENQGEQSETIAETGEKKFKLTVHKSADDKSPAIQVGINGKIWHIKKGVEVIVPASVVEILENAVKDVYIQEGEKIMRSELPSYPFSAVPYNHD